MARIGRYAVVMGCLAAFVAVLYRVANADTKSNVCPRIQDYYTLSTNPKCWYDPDFAANSNVTQIILNNGYDSETHHVTSEDGQILTLFRVVNRNKDKKNQGPVFLQHGLAGSSIGYVGLGNDSLAFIMAEAGFDVWLGNARGTIFSRNHTKYTDKDPEFWDHSYHEMAVLDLPAVFKYVRSENNNKKIIYVGMSMGTTQGLVYSSVFPEEAKENLKLMFFLSPITTNSPATGYLYRRAGPMMRKIQETLPAGFFDINLDFVTGKYNRLLIPFIPMWMQIKFYTPIFTYSGLADVNTMKPETIPKVIAHNPQGASLKAHVHLFAYPKEFRMYNYGEKKNMEVYGTKMPPKYNLTNIKVPIQMYYSDEDEVSSSEDILRLYDTLPKVSKFGIHKIVSEKFTHSDFLYGADVRNQIYDPMMDILRRLKND